MRWQSNNKTQSKTTVIKLNIIIFVKGRDIRIIMLVKLLEILLQTFEIQRETVKPNELLSQVKNGVCDDLAQMWCVLLCWSCTKPLFVPPQKPLMR